MIYQTTLKNKIKAWGVGLHTGEKIVLTLKPAPVDTGIVFRRVDLDPVIEIPAHINSIGDTRFNTCLMRKGAKVSTIEHLMSAFLGLGVDNAYVDLTGAEVPIMDGSASPFVFLIQSAGIETQNAPRKFVRIKKKIAVKEDDKWALIEPFDGFKVSIVIDFQHPIIQESQQAIIVDFSKVSFIKEVSRARTFGFLSDHEFLLKNDLALGSSLANTIGLDDSGIMNKEGLRSNDEFVLHKTLDAVGDLFLFKYPLIGAYSAYKSGHSLNSQLLKKLLESEDAWAIETFETTDALKEAPVLFCSNFTDEVNEVNV